MYKRHVGTTVYDPPCSPCKSAGTICLVQSTSHGRKTSCLNCTRQRTRCSFSQGKQGSRPTAGSSKQVIRPATPTSDHDTRPTSSLEHIDKRLNLLMTAVTSMAEHMATLAQHSADIFENTRALTQAELRRSKNDIATYEAVNRLADLHQECVHHEPKTLPMSINGDYGRSFALVTQSMGKSEYYLKNMTRVLTKISDMGQAEAKAEGEVEPKRRRTSDNEKNADAESDKDA